MLGRDVLLCSYCGGMQWDDLQLLRAIDEMEQEGQYLGNGLYLLQQVADAPAYRSTRALSRSRSSWTSPAPPAI